MQRKPLSATRHVTFEDTRDETARRIPATAMQCNPEPEQRKPIAPRYNSFLEENAKGLAILAFVIAVFANMEWQAAYAASPRFRG